VAEQQIHIISGPRGVGKSAVVELALIRGPHVQHITDESEIEKHPHILLETNCDSAMKVKKLYPEAHTTFILPPSREDLKARLFGRKQENEMEIHRYLLQAAMEIHSHASSFNSRILNGNDREMTAAHLINLMNLLRRGKKPDDFYCDNMLLAQVRSTFPSYACDPKFF
jgi:guanylate kinase